MLHLLQTSNGIGSNSTLQGIKCKNVITTKDIGDKLYNFGNRTQWLLSA